MEFNENKPIYLQIYDDICEKVLRGEFPENERILSVREWGATIGVNPNTVARSYEKLTDEQIIFNKRGIGFFVSEGAKEKVLESMRVEFLEKEWPVIKKRMELLGIDATSLL
ncbi:MAG: GntR family transcriptional regulator [Bacteroidales bacterium]|nr:GntR family transcriptional regulator [Bacteroidales bacterium]